MIRARALRALALVMMLGMALGAANAAAAAPVSAGGPVDVQIWPQDGQAVVIASCQLPEGTKLPALVRIPVVPGAKVEWAGEILGGDVSSDIAREYRLVDGVGGQYAEFYLTKSRHGQIDSVATTLSVSGTNVSASVDWVQSVESSSTVFSVRLPGGVSGVKIKPAPDGKPVESDSGELLYALPSKVLPVGGAQQVTFSYSTVPEGEPDVRPSANVIMASLLGILALAIVALVLVVRRRSS